MQHINNKEWIIPSISSHKNKNNNNNNINNDRYDKLWLAASGDDTSEDTTVNDDVNTKDDDDKDKDNDEEKLKQIKKKLTKEFFSIGLPAFIQLAAEPLAALVDTGQYYLKK
jgi:hypothetical protein